MSMGIVGVNSTAGREVKFIDPSKTTKSESSWLGYTLCDCIHIVLRCVMSHYSHYYTIWSDMRARAFNANNTLTLYNEERRLGDQRGSDTLVVPLITSNDGLSIAFIVKLQISSAYKLTWLELVSSILYLISMSIINCNYARLIDLVRSLMDISFKILFFACKHCINLWNIRLYCVHLIFGALRSISGEM